LQHPQSLVLNAIKLKTTTDQAQYNGSNPQKALPAKLPQKNKTPATQTNTINTMFTM
jgi:hypothetical protein